MAYTPAVPPQMHYYPGEQAQYLPTTPIAYAHQRATPNVPYGAPLQQVFIVKLYEWGFLTFLFSFFVIWFQESVGVRYLVIQLELTL